MTYTGEELYSKYMEYKNLKLAAKDLNMPWQTLYWNLKKLGYDVMGDKKKYGSANDKLAAHAENYFNQLVPHAINQNVKRFQSKFDFKVGEYKVDVKSSTRKIQNSNRQNTSGYQRWMFGLKDHQYQCDFLACVCYSGKDTEEFGEVEKILLIPKEFFQNYQTISVACTKSKWDDFSISQEGLSTFFSGLN
jgi:hypothetical protein